jgi:TolA-binding protein
LAKWSDIPVIERELSDIREMVGRLEEINRLQAQTIERQAEELRRAQQIITGLQAAQERARMARSGE